MSTDNAQRSWSEYVAHERAWLVPYLASHGYTLERDQPHLGGERFLMQAVTTTSGRKVILLGRTASGERVVIKASAERGGMRELVHARQCREMLSRMGFAHAVLHTPEELLFDTSHRRCVVIHRHIAQERTFLERSIEDQFAYALASFKAQEATHAATHSHLRLVRRVFPTFTTREYLHTFDTFTATVTHDARTRDLSTLFATAREKIGEPHHVERYCGFLTHTDFVPHNFRISEGTMYLLDHSSLRFGNKHDGWARFLNFMTLYHPALAQALLTYVRQNRAPEEWESLIRMRYFRLGEIIAYYTARLDVEGDVGTLNLARVHLWRALLEALLAGHTLDERLRAEYIETRDRLRSDEEKKRQVGLH